MGRRVSYKIAKTMLFIDRGVKAALVHAQAMLTQIECWLATGRAYVHLLAEFAVLIGEAACLGGRLLGCSTSGERR